MEVAFTLNLFFYLLIGSWAKSCEISIPTLAYVKACPKTEADWNAEAERKQCRLVEQNCSSSKDFQYHCLINDFANATVEVCAPVRNIIGHCAEYNYGRKGIQDHQQIKCKTCNSTYLSTDAYKYQECYELVAFKLNVENSTSNTITRSNDSIQNQDVESTFENELLILNIINTILLVIVEISVGIIGVLYLRRSPKKEN